MVLDVWSTNLWIREVFKVWFGWYLMEKIILPELCGATQWYQLDNNIISPTTTCSVTSSGCFQWWNFSLNLLLHVFLVWHLRRTWRWSSGGIIARQQICFKIMLCCRRKALTRLLVVECQTITLLFTLHSSLHRGKFNLGQIYYNLSIWQIQYRCKV